MRKGRRMTRVTTRLRRLIEQPDVLIMPGVYDGFSLRLIERHGFKAGFTTGSGLSEALLGQPDVGLMNLEENLFGARRLAALSQVPLLADADTGYGNAVNVFHTVRAFEQAGLAGVMIEDQTWPKRCGHMAGKAVVSAEEMVDKVRAALDARRDPDFVIKARTDSLATHGLDEAIRRLQSYGDAGADLLFADALTSADEIRTVAQNVDKPLCVNMGFGLQSRLTTPLLSPRELQELGVSTVIYPRLLTACAVRGMVNGLAAFSEQIDSGVVVHRPELSVSFDELNDLMGLPEVLEIEKRYVTRSAKTAKA
jgi:2-methylisocitrate lyase-like PEP mutase family enzyme